MRQSKTLARLRLPDVRASGRNEAERPASDTRCDYAAAVGNDGPAAPPIYPASYPEVVAVSAVDGRGRRLLEAGRAIHVDFCAPGADMAAPAGPSGFAAVRGTSFAAPIVAGLLGLRPRDHRG